MNTPKVSLIILNWNGVDDTIECLESIQRLTYEHYEVIVVDNGSDGDDVTILSSIFGEYIHLVCNKSNLGSSEGYNSGIRYVLNASKPKPQYIVIMNNDLVLNQNCLSELVRVADTDQKIGIVGPKIYYYDYKGSKNIIWSAGGKLRKWLPNVHYHIGENRVDGPEYHNEASVDWITGAIFMLRTSLIDEIGLFHSGYFIGLEDVEYCLRTKKHQFDILYVPTAKAWHKVGVSMRKAGRSYADPGLYYYFLKRNFSLPIYIYHLLLLPILIAQWGLLYLAGQRDRRRLYIFIRNLSRFLFNPKGNKLS